MEPEGPTFVGGGRRDEPLRVPARRCRLACHVAREDLVSERVLKRVVAGGFRPLLCCSCRARLLPIPILDPAQPVVAPTSGHAPGATIKRFVVYGVYTREQRSQLVREGYDIGEAYWPDRVELFGSDEQARLLAPCAASGSYRTSSPTTSRRRTRSTTTTPRWSPTCRRSPARYPQPFTSSRSGRHTTAGT